MNDIINNIISNPWIGIIGIVVGIASIAVTIWFFFKDRNYPCRISFYPVKTMNLYRNLSSPFLRLKITYNDKDICNNLFYFSGYLVCDGYRDITGNEESLFIKLPEGYNWLDFKVSSSVNSLNKDLYKLNKDNKIEDNVLKLDFSKFKRDESIYLQSIIEGPDDRVIDQNDISFEHRIDNTESEIKIKTFVYHSDSQQSKDFEMIIGMTLLLCVLSICLYYLDPDLFPIMYFLNNGSEYLFFISTFLIIAYFFKMKYLRIKSRKIEQIIKQGNKN